MDFRAVIGAADPESAAVAGVELDSCATDMLQAVRASHDGSSNGYGIGRRTTPA